MAKKPKDSKATRHIYTVKDVRIDDIAKTINEKETLGHTYISMIRQVQGSEGTFTLLFSEPFE